MNFANLLRASTIALLATTIGSFQLMAEAVEKKEHNYVKTNYRTASKTVVVVGDVPNHELSQDNEHSRH